MLTGLSQFYNQNIAEPSGVREIKNSPNGGVVNCCRCHRKEKKLIEETTAHFDEKEGIKFTCNQHNY